MGTILAGLAATAFTVGSTSVTYGGLLTIAALGASTASMLDQPKPQQLPGKVQNIVDKTTPQQADQLDAAVLGGDSEKRRRQTAKSKFKIDRATNTESVSGVDFESTKVTGVQI